MFIHLHSEHCDSASVTSQLDTLRHLYNIHLAVMWALGIWTPALFMLMSENIIHWRISQAPQMALIILVELLLIFIFFCFFCSEISQYIFSITNDIFCQFQWEKQFSWQLSAVVFSSKFQLSSGSPFDYFEPWNIKLFLIIWIEFVFNITISG